MLKRILTIALACLLLVSLFACGNNAQTPNTNPSTDTNTSTNAGSSDKTTPQSYQKIVYAYATFNNIPTSDTLRTVEEEINKITREKIGAEITLMPIPIFEYSQSVSLALQGGEQIDIFESLGDFNVSVSTNKAYDLTDLMESNAKESINIIGDDILQACVKDGKVYGIPTYKPYALTPMVIYKQEIADALSIDMTKVKNLNDLTDVLRKVKQARPELTPIVPVNGGQSGVSMCAGEIDYLSDDMYSPKGVLVGNDMTVVDFYGTDIFADLCGIARTWYNEGLIMQDAAVTTSAAAELMSADNSFCYVAAYSYPPEDTAASLEAQCGGVKLGAVQIGDAYLGTDSVNSLTWMVSSTSKAPEAALKFLNMTFTDADIINLLIYGIEGRDYVKDAEGYVAYPDGQDASTVPYTAQLSCGTLGNFFLMYPMAGTSKESLVWEEEQNRIAKKSPAMGFTFNTDNVKTAYTAVNNVITKYLPGLICGSVDPTVVIPEFCDSLNTAGLNKIIDEKQAQLDEWKKTNN